MVTAAGDFLHVSWGHDMVGLAAAHAGFYEFREFLKAGLDQVDADDVFGPCVVKFLAGVVAAEFDLVGLTFAAVGFALDGGRTGITDGLTWSCGVGLWRG